MKSSIARRLLLGFILVSLIPLDLLAFLYLYQLEASLRQQALVEMSHLADKKADQIDAFINERLADARVLARSEQISAALHLMGDALAHGGVAGSEHRRRSARFDPDFREYLEASGYYDLLLIDTAGNVVYTVDKESDLGSNLLNGPLRNTELARGFRQAMATLSMELTPFHPYVPSNNQVSAFIVKPLMEAGRPVGVLALQLNLERLREVVTDRTGLGKSGETVLAQRSGDQALYTAPLTRVADAAYRYRVPLHQAAPPMRQALGGGRDKGVVSDYAGIEVAAAWRYLPSLSWGMVVKKDMTEVLEPLHPMRRVSLAALAMVALLAAVVAYFLGRTITRPIDRLGQAASAIAEDNLAQRVKSDRRDELGHLADAFNRMVDRLREGRDQLEARVEARTTELRQANFHLEESEQRYRILVEHAPEAIVVFDNDSGLLVEANEPAARLFGRSREDLLQSSLPDLSPPLQPDGHSSAPAAMRLIHRTLAGANPVFEWHHLHADGHTIPCEVRLVRLPASARNLVRGSMTDISERKAAESLLQRDREQQRTLREMLEDVVKEGSMQDILSRCLERLLAVSWLSLLHKGGIFLMEQDGKYLRLSASRNLSQEILSLCDRVPLGLCHCGQVALSRQVQFSNCLDHRHEISYPGMEEHGHYNLPLLSEGEVVGVMVLYLPPGFERDPDKEQFLTMVADVLAGFIRRKHAEETLRQLNEELEDRVEERTLALVVAKDEAERASRAKSEFLSRMSHELRTPLNAILGFGQLLELHIRDAEQVDNVQEILHAGQHLLELINEVLDLARIESGRLSISQEPIALRTLIVDCLALIRVQAEARGIRINQAERGCDTQVLADSTRLKQVLLNLLSNAVKYNRDQGELSVVCIDLGDNVQIRVSDTGVGLSPEQRSRLFVAFERLGADRSAIEGTGIGLALSKRLVELMQGEIGVESSPGAGSTFWINLPVANRLLPAAPDANGEAGGFFDCLTQPLDTDKLAQASDESTFDRHC